MRVSHLAPSGYRQMPWKNGLGVTTEVARFPREGEFDWRVSIAAVLEDGAFSTFPGCDRVILTLEGAGMILNHHDQRADVVLGPLESWSFSGDGETSCVLRDGAIRDFNVITRRAVYTSAVSVLHLDEPQTIPIVATTTLFYCVAGTIIVEHASPSVLAADETLMFEREDGENAESAIHASGQATIIQVQLESSASPH